MKKKTFYSLLLTALCVWSCKEETQTKNSYTSQEKKPKIHIENDGLRGSSYYDSMGKQCYYRRVLARIVNDTLVPIKLHLFFANKSVDLHPSSDKKFKAFIFPELKSEKENNYTPTTFLVNNESEKPLELNKVIQPGETYPINLELFFNSASGGTGTTYAQILLENPKNRLSLRDTLTSSKRLNVLLNVFLESNSASVSCGYLSF